MRLSIDIALMNDASASPVCSVYPAYTLQMYAQRHPEFWVNTDARVRGLVPGDRLEVIFV
jgi:hypothetical protein